MVKSALGIARSSRVKRWRVSRSFIQRSLPAICLSAVHFSRARICRWLRV